MSGNSHTWLPVEEISARVAALESLLIEKGLAESEAIDNVIDTYENDLGPMNGAKVVARAWVDPKFKEWLLEDATAAIGDMGFLGLQTEHMVALENTDTDHHMWVCTLCSCYPWTLLGITPSWFKYPQYRARVVEHPREVLKEFGVELDDSVKIHVWDSSAEVRFIVIPQRPAGTENMNEEELAALVTRDSMIGVGFPKEDPRFAAVASA